MAKLVIKAWTNGLSSNNHEREATKILRETITRNLEFMKSGLGLQLDPSNLDSIENLNKEDCNTTIRIVKVLLNMRAEKDDVLSQIEKLALDKKECAMGQGQTRLLEGYFDFIRRELMKDLSIAELQSLTLISACFDYNKYFLYEVLKVFIEETFEEMKEKYNSQFLGSDSISDNETEMNEKVYYITNVLFPRLRSECVNTLKNEIKQIIKESSERKKTKRPFRHTAYLHSIGICGFSYSDEYDVYYEYFEENSSKWDVKKWVKDEQLKSEIRELDKVNWVFDREKLDDFFFDEPSSSTLLPSAVHPDITAFIKNLSKKDSECKAPKMSPEIRKYLHENLGDDSLMVSNISKVNVFSLPEKVKISMKKHGYKGKILNKINKKPKIYIMLALLSNYICGKPLLPFDATRLALCALCYEKITKEKLSLREPKYRSTTEVNRNTLMISAIMSKKSILETPMFYLVTIGYILTRAIDAYYEDTRYAQEYMDWLEIKRDLSNLLIDRTIIEEKTISGIIKERNEIFTLLREKIEARKSAILNDTRNSLFDLSHNI